jgi:hypothetical protein
VQARALEAFHIALEILEKRRRQPVRDENRLLFPGVVQTGGGCAKQHVLTHASRHTESSIEPRRVDRHRPRSAMNRLQ